MQNTLTFHPILDIPTLEEQNPSVFAIESKQEFTKVTSRELAEARQSSVEYRFRRVLVGIALVILGVFFGLFSLTLPD